MCLFAAQDMFKGSPICEDFSHVGNFPNFPTWANYEDVCPPT